MCWQAIVQGVGQAASSSAGQAVAGYAIGAANRSKLPTQSPTPPPVHMSGVEQDQTKRKARRDLRRTQSVFAGESGGKQTLG
jgi:hypothetical protein